MKNNKLLLGGIVSLGAYLLLRSKPVATTIKGLGAAGLVSSAAMAEVVGTIRRVSSDLQAQIARAVQLTGTPAWIIEAISAHEIRYKPYTFINPSVHATGPMQMTPTTMFDVYFFVMKMGLETPALKQYMQGVLGDKFPAFIKLAKNRKADASYGRFLLDSQFNVVMGALLLRCLMNLFTQGGNLDLAKLALGYNRGIGYATTKMIGPNLANATPQQLIDTAPSSEARAYIKDMVGTGGWFDQVRLTSTQ